MMHKLTLYLSLLVALAKQKAAVDGRTQQATASINKLFSQQKCTFFVLLFKTGYDNIWSVVKNRRT